MPLIQLPPSHLLSISDGDTPEVEMEVRMLGIDAPELHFPQGLDVAEQDTRAVQRAHERKKGSGLYFIVHGC